MKNLRKRLGVILLCLIGLLVAIYLLANVFYFNTESYYRNLIRQADYVELRAFNKDLDVATIKYKEKISKLADSINFCGLWIPLDYLIFNHCRIIVHKGDLEEHILIKGSRIIHGSWTVAVDFKTIEVIMKLIKESENAVHIPFEEAWKSEYFIPITVN
ncbi:MAG: hypothetical protein ISS77_06615 [Phycisphaerae bacterium]|nr:hypothetical protein [Phycisphaerae bacterium]